jgi:hypothetical protein
MATGNHQERWILEVVRGREPGRRHTLAGGETVLGNDLAGAPGLDLAGQEVAGSPRRMAGRQSALVLSGGTLSIRDLESPGGTFVNRQRLFVGQARTLQPGDVIQLGGVQLQVKREAPAPASVEPQRPSQPQPTARVSVAAPTASSPPPRTSASGPGTLPQPFSMAAGGATCRTWDDFLTLAAQRWTLLREELTSGRLSDYLRRIGRANLAPRLEAGATADDQLDAWLGRLPTTRSSAPELDVHPQTLIVRSALGGGILKQTLRVTNVGYRLLRATARVESAGSVTVRLASEFAGRSFITIDETELPVQIDLPERATSASLGAIVLESNGGTRRVEIRLERPVAAAIPEPTAAVREPIDLAGLGRPLRDRVAALPLGSRLAAGVFAFVAFRLLILLAGFIPLGGPATGGAEPRLGAIAAVCAAAGLLVGLVRGGRGGDVRDVAAAGFTAALLGTFAAAVGYAIVRSGEALLGGWASSSLAVLVLWAALGAAAATLSWLVAPSTQEHSPASVRDPELAP